ncbi:hypothetical protein TVAG_459620 [Trichomonas vaginalis G3]|uniref:C2 NT-type domain-containing protein n=1 Tax=Trichomonas vaginalis (strain ATCC PRA-98 / G3) TaxID=412133 RepID=A2FHM2_TRIV3|nr:hypothetical protein TVAGG3_0741890 [Trichomonas vaginalis G3]EAX95613.1 hypothetical protein TVAG_459620 [Trichomonas vaginalis G3]KAI5511941.1 hypothetical protein TVAGG3_0741890 [Trichomonas vaginalis G3]|eukprot:XP_001308543.1 hypothetical protein [Trichomonas vaginalis G3]
MDVPSYFIFYVQKIEYPRMIYSQYTLTYITVELQKVTLGIKHSSEKVRSKTATLDNANCGVFECEACFNNPKQDNKQKLIHIVIGAVQDSEIEIGSIDLDLEDIDKHKSKLAIKKIRFGKHQKGKLYYRAIVLPITFFPHGKPIDFFASVPINNTKDDILTNLALTQTLTESVYDEVHENFVQSNDNRVTSLSKFTKTFEPKSSNSSSQQQQPTLARDTQRISSIKKLTKHMVRPDEGEEEINPENVQSAEKVVEIDHSQEELKEMMKHSKKKLVSAMVAQFTAKFSLIVFQKIVCADLFTEDISQDLIAPVLEFNLLSAPKISSDQLIYALMPLFSAIHITLKRRSEVVPLFSLLSSLINFGILLTSEAEYYTTAHVPVMASLDGHISILISQLSCFLYGPLVSSMTNNPLEAMTSQSATDLSNILQQFFTVAKTYVKSKYIMKLLIDRTCSLTDEIVSNCLIQFSQVFTEEQCANLKRKIEKLKEYFAYNVKEIPVNFPHMQQIISKRNRNVQRVESAKDEDVIFSFDELRRIAIDEEGKPSTQAK